MNPFIDPCLSSVRPDALERTLLWLEDLYQRLESVSTPATVKLRLNLSQAVAQYRNELYRRRIGAGNRAA